jgi:Alpha-galactosidases/6-phospho-beta-glucosidases, family 4 of glycosyl hydrolases
MKLALIGGAGVRTPSMIDSLVRRHHEIPIRELVIHDIDPHKIDTIGAIVKHLVRQHGSPFRVETTTDFAKAVEGADFIYTAIRVGGEESRAIDERVALRHGVLGQETTGPGGFSMALRTIPVMLEYARIIERESPNAWVVNFTNPAGLITEALSNYTRLNLIGICDAPSALKLDIAKFLNEPADDIHLHYFGLNHLGWVNRVTVRGNDRLPYIIDHYDRFARSCPHMACFSPELIRQLRMLPNEYLYYYYYREQAVNHILSSPHTRGEQIAEWNRNLLAQLKEKLQEGDIEAAIALYADTMQKRQNSYMSAETGKAGNAGSMQHKPLDTSQASLENEGYAGLALSIMSAICNNKKTCLILNVPNRGTIADLRDDDVVEVPCMLDANGPVPLAAGALPDSVKGLIQSVKQYERYTVSAAVNGSYEDAVWALTVHPLVASYSLAQKIVDDYVQRHQPYLSKFGKKGVSHV